MWKTIKVTFRKNKSSFIMILMKIQLNGTSNQNKKFKIILWHENILMALLLAPQRENNIIIERLACCSHEQYLIFD
jgi:hypothetical protein